MRFWFITIFSLVILLDLSSKFQAAQMTEVHLNQGLALGWLGVGESGWLVGLLWLAGAAVTASVLLMSASFQERLAQALFLGGIWANLIDRLISGGAVRDWLRVPVLGLYNNLADWSIFIGVSIWISLLFLRIKTSSSSTNQPE